MSDCCHIEHVEMNEKTEETKKRRIRLFVGGKYLNSYVDAKVEVISSEHIRIITTKGETIDVYNGTVVVDDYYREIE